MLGCCQIVGYSQLLALCERIPDQSNQVSSTAYRKLEVLDLSGGSWRTQLTIAHSGPMADGSKQASRRISGKYCWPSQVQSSRDSRRYLSLKWQVPGFLLRQISYSTFACCKSFDGNVVKIDELMNLKFEVRRRNM